MRKIITSNSQVEFHEISNDGVILNIKAFQYGVLHYQIKNGKVVFYSNADENPWRNEVWSVDMPVTIDDEVYSTADEVAEALSAVMNDSFQEQLDELQEGLATEEGRAQAAEEALQTAIENETSRATSAETNLQSEITSVSATVATFDGRITNVENGLSALTETVNGEITRSTAKDAEHDALISGLTTSLQNEVTRAQGAESALTNSLNNEIARATSAETQLHNEILDEKNRAISAETAIDNKVDAEIARSTAKDASQDALISGLTTSLQNEINRAQGAENSLRSDLNAEIARATNAEDALDDKIDLEIQNRIDAVSGLTARVAAEETRASNAETALNEKVNALSAYNASQDAQIEAVTNSINTEISRATSVENAIRSDLNAEISARTNADATQLQRITALEVGKADANSVYTKAESDAKYTTKDYISGLTEAFFDAAAYDSQTKKINFYHGNTIKAQIDATSFIKDGMVDNVAISGSNLVITFNTDAGKEPISIPLSSIFDPSNYYTKSEIDSALSGKADSNDVYTKNEVYTKAEVDEAIAEIDLSDYYTKSEVDASQLVQDNKINAISGDVQTLNEKVDTISGSAITSGEVQTQIDNSISGKADKTDIYTYLGSDRIKVSTAAGVRRKTIDLNLPIYSGSGMSSLSLNSIIGTAQGGNQIKGYFSTGIGFGLTTNNASEVATGQYNISNTVGGVSWGNSGNTLFSVGNGEHQGDEHNAFEVRQNGDIYITSGGTTSSSMIKLQDHLGGGGGGVTPSEVQTMIDESISGKTNQSDFTAHTSNTNVHVTASEKSTWNAKSDFSGDYNDLTNKPTIPNYTAGSGITISNNVISAKIWSGTKAQYEALTTKSSDIIYLIYNS